MLNRREMLARSATVAGLMAAAGLLPTSAMAAWNQGAFEAKSLADVMKALGAAAPVESKDVTITGPDIAENGAVVPVGSGELLFSYADANANNAAELGKVAGDAKLFALGYNHILSKRTTIYATLSQIKNEGVAKFVVAGGNAVNAGGTSRGADVGIRHSF